MKVENKKVISLIYKLRVDSEDGEIIEDVLKDEPMIFLYEGGYMLPKFEENVKGLEVGSNFKFKIDCEDAYGMAEEDAVVDLPISNFEVDGEIDNEMLEEGNVIPMRDEEGNYFDGVVVEANSETVIIDFNHPFAGDDLYFTGEIVEIKDATEEEIKQGFAEGERVDEDEIV